MRSVAEIIGWEWRGMRVYEVPVGGSTVVATNPPRYYGPETGHGYWAPPGVTVADAMGCQPNVDDMLAWLRERVLPWEIWGNGEAVTFSRVIGDGRHSRRETLGSGATLNEALEAAVRTVAGE